MINEFTQIIDKLTPEQTKTLSGMITNLLKVLDQVSPGALPVAIVLMKPENGNVELMIDAKNPTEAFQTLQKIRTAVNKMPTSILQG